MNIQSDIDALHAGIGLGSIPDTIYGSLNTTWSILGV